MIEKGKGTCSSKYEIAHTNIDKMQGQDANCQSEYTRLGNTISKRCHETQQIRRLIRKSSNT